MDNTLKTKLLFEISQIDKLLNDSKPLLDLYKIKTPDFIEMSAGAMTLHSFYNGVENILTLIFKNHFRRTTLRVLSSRRHLLNRR